ncbi:glycosyltransferase family 2 protein [Leeuwenhoekiella nanhaiensis]|uniref:glycosyltransferase family 2 protein n=1 Tax=Leeuwenhoekiella nanhaiensis TaxID=1655491 RepID=UPI001670B23D|nr:glycosyltransferase family 2 protein [Leeuwenhoekiella nanhaiensis]
MKSSNYPKVTILLATFNRAHLILETLESIANQTYANFECLITDDNSTDDTEVVVSAFIESDSRFFYFKKPKQYPQGLSATRNYGLDLAENLKGIYILFVDDDDIVGPRNLEVCISVFKDLDLDFIHYKIQPFTGGFKGFKSVELQPEGICNIDKTRLIEVLDNKIPLASCSVMWNKTALKYERFDEELPYAEELEFYARLIAKGRKGCAISAILYYNRKHLNSNTGAFNSGSPVYLKGLLDAYYKTVDNLTILNLDDYKLAKFFVWKAAIYNEKSLYKYVLKKMNLNFYNKLRLKSIYNLKPVISLILKSKKSSKKC